MEEMFEEVEPKDDEILEYDPIKEGKIDKINAAKFKENWEKHHS